MDWSDALRIIPGVVGAITGIIGSVTGGLALYFNRRDARRAAEAVQPRATVNLISHPEADGWYLIKLTFDNVREAIVLTTAEIIQPHNGIISPRRKIGNGTMVRNYEIEGRKVAVNWRVDPQKDDRTAAGFAHLSLKLLPESAPQLATLRLKGHQVAGLQRPVEINATGRASVG